LLLFLFGRPLLGAILLVGIGSIVLVIIVVIIGLVLVALQLDFFLAQIEVGSQRCIQSPQHPVKVKKKKKIRREEEEKRKRRTEMGREWEMERRATAVELRAEEFAGETVASSSTDSPSASWSRGLWNLWSSSSSSTTSMSGSES
jgi:hypothetical protein